MPTPSGPKDAAGSLAAGPEDRRAVRDELRQCLSSINRDIDFLRSYVSSEDLLAELIQIVRQIEQDLCSDEDQK